MKIRNGWVSNSSSSSFLIHGVSFESLNEVSETLTEEFFGNLKEETRENLKKDLEEGDTELLYEVISEDLKDLQTHYTPWDTVCIGRSWDEVGDNQTGKEFKKETEDLINKYFGKAKDLQYSTIEEAYMDC